MCDCNSRCDMRPDRVIPPGTDPLAGGLPLYGTGFSNPLMGNPRGEPSATVPSVDNRANTANTTIGSGGFPAAIPKGAAAGAALADSTNTTSGDLMSMLEEHWPWLIVAVLVAAAIIYEER